MQATVDVDELVSTIRNKGTVTSAEYRLLTGACESGLGDGLESLGLSRDTPELPLEQVLQLSRGRYGGEQIAELFAEPTE
jgi:hypothetical protein